MHDAPTAPTASLPLGTLRALAVRASCDPRTVLRVYRGQPVRGLAGERARDALVAEGLLPAARKRAA